MEKGQTSSFAFLPLTAPTVYWCNPILIPDCVWAAHYFNPYKLHDGKVQVSGDLDLIRMLSSPNVGGGSHCSSAHQSNTSLASSQQLLQLSRCYKCSKLMTAAAGATASSLPRGSMDYLLYENIRLRERMRRRRSTGSHLVRGLHRLRIKRFR